jgi:hypothetical protein
MWLMAGLIGCNLVTLGYHFHQSWERRAAERNAVVPIFDGTDLVGNDWHPSDAPCRVLRITADNCEFCVKDGPSYASLIEVARKARCEIVEVSPRAGDMAEIQRLGIVQLKYISQDLGRNLATPQTIILDRDFSVRWSRLGAFSDKTLREAKSVLEGLSAH